MSEKPDRPHSAPKATNDIDMHDIELKDMQQNDENQDTRNQENEAMLQDKSNNGFIRPPGCSIYDSLVTSVLNAISIFFMVGGVVAPSLVLFLLPFNFYYMLIYAVLIIPILVSLVNAYYAFLVWLRGARMCRFCLLLNGFIALGTFSASLCIVVGVWGTYSLLEYTK